MLHLYYFTANLAAQEGIEFFLGGKGDMDLNFLDAMGGEGEEHVAARADLHIVQKTDAKDGAFERIALRKVFFDLQAFVAFVEREIVQIPQGAFGCQPFEGKQGFLPAFEDGGGVDAQDRVAVLTPLEGAMVYEWQVDDRHGRCPLDAFLDEGLPSEASPCQFRAKLANKRLKRYDYSCKSPNP